MTILAIESAARAASVCIMQDDELLAEYTSNLKMTHSQTLLPMINETMKIADIRTDMLDGIAVDVGPGSYTGLRIGIATAKGLALAAKPDDEALEGIPCVEVSSLETLSLNVARSEDVYICPVMDAKRNRVFCAIYKYIDADSGRRSQAILNDTVMDCAELLKKLETYNKKIIFVGDGVSAIKNAIKAYTECTLIYEFASGHENVARAANVAMIGRMRLWDGMGVSADFLLPEYITESQAERLRFRPMEEKDTSFAAAIEAESISKPWNKSAFDDVLKRDECIYIVCDSGGRVRALAGMWVSQDEAEITNVAVEEESRRKGIGYGILKHLINEGIKKGVSEIFLEVRKSNEPAKALYSKLGFESVMERKNFYESPKEDAIVMRYKV